MVYAIIIITSIWVYFDARRIGARRGLLSGFFNMGPVAWMLVCLLFWIVGFPAYLFMRSEIKNAANGEVGSSSSSKTEQSGLNTAAKIVAVGWTLLFAILFLTGLAEMSSVAPTSGNQYEQAGFAIGATLGFGMYLVIWAVVAVPATIVYLVTRRSAPVVIVGQPPRQTEPERTKECPYCAEKIKADAVFCRFCSKDLAQAAKLPPPLMEEIKEPPKIDWLSRSRANLKSGEFKEAVTTCTRAIENNAGGEGYYLRAVAYSKMKDQQKMRADLEQAAKLGHKKAMETVEKLTVMS